MHYGAPKERYVLHQSCSRPEPTRPLVILADRRKYGKAGFEAIQTLYHWGCQFFFNADIQPNFRELGILETR